MRKCEHGVYWPQGQDVAEFCQFCNPATNDSPTDAPKTAPIVFNRHGSLALTETGRLPKCPNCNGTSILAVSNGGKCIICHHEFEIKQPGKLRANNSQPGVCPECGSG